ncbi:MAG: SWIM zinc finger family protein [Burkholderiales bacterium]
MAFDDYYFKPYVPAAVRKQRAQNAAARLDKKGASRDPVTIAGSAIARTFWGRSWCRNMERYSDFYSRLGRGRSYVRSGAVLDLHIEQGAVAASVMGSRLYTVEVKIGPVPKARWDALCKRCAGGIDSVVELLQGRFSDAVMGHICGDECGLFPAPREIRFNCTCPDWASMCKHVAAVLYGIGARFDTRPELFFRLRGVDGGDLIAAAGQGVTAAPAGAGTARRLEDADLSALFGIEIVEPGASRAPTSRQPHAKKRAAAKGRPRSRKQRV